jgi:thioredoxin 1
MLSASPPYSAAQPSRADIDALAGPVVLEFGTNWCGYCRAAQPLIATALAAHPGVHHIKIEDGSGRPLGRSFRVRLWPTLVFLDAGQELARLVRPADIGAIERALESILGVA